MISSISFLKSTSPVMVGGQFAVAETLQQHPAAGVPELPQGHGPHPQPGVPSHAAVEDVLVVGRGGASEDKLPLLGSLAHLVAHSVPQG